MNSGDGDTDDAFSIVGHPQMRILIVEDSDRLSSLLCETLSDAGYASDRAATLAEARAFLGLDGGAPAAGYDAAIVDLGLPDGDGTTLIKALRAARRTLPVLVLTARHGLDDRVTALDSGSDDYLAKPFANAELLARLRALVRRPGLAVAPVLTVVTSPSIRPTEP